MRSRPRRRRDHRRCQIGRLPSRIQRKLSAFPRRDRVKGRRTLLNFRAAAMRADNFSLAGFRQGQDLGKRLAASEAQVFVGRHFILPRMVQETFYSRGMAAAGRRAKQKASAVICSGLDPVLRGVTRFLGAVLVRGSFQAWEKGGEAGDTGMTQAQAAESKIPLILLHDAFRDPKAQSGSFARFGGKKWLEDFSRIFPLHP